MSDVYEPWERLIRIVVLGKALDVPEKNLLLRQQLEDFRAGREVNNYVPEQRLSRREKKHLLSSFRAIENLRATLRMEFSSSPL